MPPHGGACSGSATSGSSSWDRASAPIGTAVTYVALPLIAVSAPGPPFEVSLITAAGYAAWLLVGLPAGVFVDRRNGVRS